MEERVFGVHARKYFEETDVVCDVSRGCSLFMRPLHSWTVVRLWLHHQKGVKEKPQEQGGDHASPITHVRAAVREPNPVCKARWSYGGATYERTVPTKTFTRELTKRLIDLSRLICRKSSIIHDTFAIYRYRNHDDIWESIIRNYL